MISESQINDLVAEIIAAYQPERIILFGSYAYGEPNEHSDLDICVVKTDDRSRKNKQFELGRKLTNRTFPLDLVVLQPQDLEDPSMYKLILWEIKNKGRVIYEQ